MAFVAGLVVVLLMIPINRWLTQQIQTASVAMMAAKDARLGSLQVRLALLQTSIVTFCYMSVSTCEGPLPHIVNIRVV